MRAKCLLLIESNTTGTGRLFAQAAVRRGLVPVLLSANPARYPYVAQDHLRTVEVDTAAPEATETACGSLAAEFEIAGITSSSEHYVPLAATLAAARHLPAPSPEAVRRCRSKAQQRSRFAQAGVPSPAAVKVPSVDEAVAAARQIGLPVIVKPVSGTGSVGVRLCTGESAVGIQVAALLAEGANERGLRTEAAALVEEYIQGEEFSVETFGRQVVGITRKYPNTPPRFVAPGHDYPGLPEDGGELAKSIGDTVLRALDAMELGWGPAHTEITVKAGKVYVIEINPRLGGAMIPELVRLATGVDLVSATVDLSIGGSPDLTRNKSLHSSIAFAFAEETGTVLNVTALESVRALPGVVEATMTLRPGETVQPRGDFRDKIGFVIAVGDTQAEAHHRAATAAGRLGYRV